MRKHIFVRPARVEDGPKCIEWSLRTRDNMIDPDVIGYKTTFILCAYDSKGPLVFVPIQRPFMMESLAIRPGADPVDVSVALKELTQHLVSKAHEEGIGEIYFLCREATTIAFAGRQCFEEILRDKDRGIVLMRIKIANLERGTLEACGAQEGPTNANNIAARNVV